MRLKTIATMATFMVLMTAPVFVKAQTTDEGRPVLNITDASIQAGQTVTWTNDFVYHLDGVVFVEAGAKLYIEPGTIIKAQDGTNTDATALVISRGGKIFAVGTPDEPIIFTSIQDNLSSVDLLTYQDRGLWGGIVILGNAVTNNAGDSAGEWEEVEGINELVTEGDHRAEYGGTDDDDNSGVMRYVSIRHTGINIGDSDGNEIQGLTLGAVGRGTTLEYIESYASDDDGMEIFGGTVDLSHIVLAYNTDDSIDWDQGWRGRAQFIFVVQGTDKAGAAAEQDGAGGDENTEPFAEPTFYNVTYVGAGVGNQPAGDRAEMLIFRDNAGGHYYNSIFTDFQTDQGGFALTIEDVDNTGSMPLDSRQRFEAGDLTLENNLWWGFGAGNTPAAFVNTDLANHDDIVNHLTTHGNVFVDPMLGAIERGTTPGGTMDPRPAVDSPAFTSARADYPSDPFFSHVDYLGAFGRGNWALGWTALDELGYFARPDEDVESRPQVAVTDASINAGDTVYWTADNVYIMDGVVFVESGAELHIEAGTVIKAQDGTNTDATALVISRGGKIFAEGTANEPIIFTSIQDNLSSADLLTYQDRGLWGGIVILGNAVTNNAGDSAGEWEEVEGINELVAEGDHRAEYGGTDDDDNSGVMRYVSIRHTGINIGDSDGNEIQGLTLGAVGRGTTLEYIESYASDDDGMEIFGGTVDLKHIVLVFDTDDSIDWDQGWRGRAQFVFVLQGTDKAGAAAEQDGAGGDENTEPFAEPTFYNVTYVGAGVGNQPAGDRAEMLIFRDNAGGHYYNSIFTDFQTDQGGFALTIEDVDNTGSMPLDSRQRFEAGDLTLENNLWWGFGAGNTPAAFVNTDLANHDDIVNHLTAHGNVFVDPMLAGIERGTTGTGMLDPRPTGNSPAFTSPRHAYPNDGFFTTTDYHGAFGRVNWMHGWTALDAMGYLGDLAANQSVAAEDEAELPSSISLSQNYPNPFNPATNIEFKLQQAQKVRLSVHDVLGREVAVLVDGVQPAGTHIARFDASKLASGTYFYRLQTPEATVSRMMTFIK